MISKDVWANPGSSPFPEPGSSLLVPCWRRKRKSRNQRYLELFRRFLERQTIYGWHTASFQGRNNYRKTDPDITFMHMKDNHMRNAR